LEINAQSDQAEFVKPLAAIFAFQPVQFDCGTLTLADIAQDVSSQPIILGAHVHHSVFIGGSGPSMSLADWNRTVTAHRPNSRPDRTR
jgi:hypothetical protein